MAASIHTATNHADVRAAANVIASAFTDLKACAWLEPDADYRHTTLRDVFTITVEHALQYGVVHLMTLHAGEPPAGAAVWLDCTRQLPPPVDYYRRLQAAAGTNAAAFRHLDSLFEAHHPEHPHHYLALLATLLAEQGAGIGTSLLTHHHTVLDEQGIPAYLEAADPRSRRLYERHGYERTGTEFALPNGAVFTPMWCPAQPVGSAGSV